MNLPSAAVPVAISMAILLGACTPEEAQVEDVPVPETPSVPFDQSSMEADIAYLADPALDGRVPGTEGDQAARDMIAERFAALGLEGHNGAEDYEQPFTTYDNDDAANLIGYIAGTDPEVASDIILVSAHYDHLGNGKLGANDNASGVSGLLSIAQAFAEGAPPARTMMFAAFGAEESGFEGAYAFIEASGTAPNPARVVYNVNMDMIGSYDEEGIVYALGAVEGTAAHDLLAAADTDLEVGLEDISDQSDNVVFCEVGVPYVFFWTSDHPCYHKKCDTADRIDGARLVDIAELVFDLADTLGRSTEDLAGAVKKGVNVCGE